MPRYMYKYTYVLLYGKMKYIKPITIYLYARRSRIISLDSYRRFLGRTSRISVKFNTSSYIYIYIIVIPLQSWLQSIPSSSMSHQTACLCTRNKPQDEFVRRSQRVVTLLRANVSPMCVRNTFARWFISAYKSNGGRRASGCPTRGQ